MGGKTTWFAHAYFSNPISGAIVTTITISQIHKGRFGTLAVAKIPQITGGSGSAISYELEIFKTVKVAGRQLNPVSAKCADGKAKFHVEAKFEDGTEAETELIRGASGGEGRDGEGRAGGRHTSPTGFLPFGQLRALWPP